MFSKKPRFHFYLLGLGRVHVYMFSRCVLSGAALEESNSKLYDVRKPYHAYI